MGKTTEENVNEILKSVDTDIQDIVSLRIPYALISYLKSEAAKKGVSYLDLVRVALFKTYPQFANSNFVRRMDRAERISGGKWEYRQDDADRVPTEADSIMGVGAKIVKGADNE